MTSPTRPEWRVHYDEVDLNSMVDFFVQAYKPKQGAKVEDYDYFLDPFKRKIIVRLYLSGGAA